MCWLNGWVTVLLHLLWTFVLRSGEGGEGRESSKLWAKSYFRTSCGLYIWINYKNVLLIKRSIRRLRGLFLHSNTWQKIWSRNRTYPWVWLRADSGCWLSLWWNVPPLWRINRAVMTVSKWENPGRICKAEETLVGILLRQKSEDEFSFKIFIEHRWLAALYFKCTAEWIGYRCT